MPPVRWKPLLAVMVTTLFIIANVTSVKLESISMSEDGWRPIIGSHREPSYDDEITQYKNPANKKSETVKIEKLHKMPSKSFDTSQQVTTSNNLNSPTPLGSKIPPHSKPMIMLQQQSVHGPPLPLGPLMHRPIKYGHISKINPHKRHKPFRMQVPAYSNRDEIFVPAPSSNIGPYTFYSAAQPPVKTRISQPAPIDFSNHFGQEEIYQVLRSPVQQYVLPKHPIQNDVHYNFQNADDYTRNYVPSPYKFVQEKEKQKIIKFKDVQEEQAKPNNGILVQVSPPFQYTSSINNPKEKAVEVQVTKEKVKLYNNVPNFQQEYDYHTVRTPPKFTYEVTEGKQWSEPQFIYHYSTRNPVKTRRPTVFTEESKPFLPTPLKPDTVPPTLPTESEVSTIYNQIAQLNKKKPTAGYFDIKEVSTHFPIIRERPDYQEYPTRISIIGNQDIYGNEITTKYQDRPTFAYENTQVETTTTPRTTVPTRPRERKRPQRRRRPTQKPTTTEESDVSTETYEVQKTESSVEEERPTRGRRPSRYRSTTQASVEEEYTTRMRHRPRRPTTTEESTESVEVPSNHKTSYSEPTVESYTIEDVRYSGRPVTEKDFPASLESHFASTKASQESTEEYGEYDKPSRYYNRPPSRGESRYEDEVVHEEQTRKPEPTTKSIDFDAFNSHTPENEIDYTTHQLAATTTTTSQPETTTTQSTTTTTTTTTTEAATKSHRIRTRPVKYDNSNRPRFSVKEYRQRLSTTTTTTESSRPSPSYPESMRNRYPNRSRRPITTIGHTETEESTEPMRSKFVPKDARHSLDNSTEKAFKPVNTRLRPFGRYKSTTEPSSTTVRVSIKPNIFSNLRRPTPISLKTRIMNKQKTTTEKAEEQTDEDSLEETNETDMSEIVESTIPYSVESSTEFGAKVTVDVETSTKKSDGTDILKSEEFMQSQIVSDLTSSAKNDYNKPGVFKNVPSSSRKVPSYFTLATDDPILPIEAFFPNLKDKQ